LEILKARYRLGCSKLYRGVRKQALNFGIALDSPEVVTKYIGSLHSYIRHSLLLFEPTTIDSASVKAIHLENRGTHE